MKISKNEPNNITFEDVNCGDVFFYEGDYYIKLDDILFDRDHNDYNCVYLSDGITAYIEENEIVELVNGEFKIY
jgi:hypothetical protein